MSSILKIFSGGNLWFERLEKLFTLFLLNPLTLTNEVLVGRRMEGSGYLSRKGFCQFLPTHSFFTEKLILFFFCYLIG